MCQLFCIIANYHHLHTRENAFSNISSLDVLHSNDKTNTNIKDNIRHFEEINNSQNLHTIYKFDETPRILNWRVRLMDLKTNYDKTAVKWISANVCHFQRRPRLFYNWKDLSPEGVVWGTIEGPQSDLDSDRVNKMTADSAVINQQSPIQEIVCTQMDNSKNLKTNTFNL